MAERIGWQLTRGWLKKVFPGRADTVFEILAAREAWDVSRMEDDFHGPVIDAGKWTVGNGAGAGAASPAIDVGLANGAIKMVTGTAGDDTAASVLAGGRHFTGD